MKRILCYGDSNTWGWMPGSGGRYPKETRWPGVLQSTLGGEFEVIEEGLPGRTTVWDDPIEGFKNGRDYLIPCLYSHQPLDLVIIMLGTNDLKTRFSVSANDIAESVGKLVQIVQTSQFSSEKTNPEVLVIAPPPLGKLNAEGSEKFAGGVEKSRNFAQAYKLMTELLDCHFLDAGEVIASSEVDGAHLEAEDHKKLGKVVADHTMKLFPGEEV